MGKLEELMRSAGGSILESASHRGAPVAMPTAGAGSTLGGGPLGGAVRSKSALEIPITKIERDENQPREEFDEEALVRLAESLRTHGQISPITVRPDKGRGVYIVVAGERRWRAAEKAGLATISCNVLDREISSSDLLALQCVENLIREDLRPIEQAKAFKTLIDLNGWSGNELAKHLGIPQSGVAQALQLLTLPEPVQARVEAGDIRPSTGVILSKIEDPEQQAEVAARVVNEKLSREETAEVVRKIAPRPKSPGKAKGPKVVPPPTERKHRAANGIKVTGERRKGFSLTEWLEALEDAAAGVRAAMAEQGGSAQNQAAA